MNTNIFQTAVALSDGELLSRIQALAGSERETTAELVAHLAALELRPSLYAALGYGTLFDYCTQALRLSEDAACTRTRAARICRRFPVVLDLLSSGAVSLTAIRLLQPHLTAENHQAVLARATHKTCEQVQALVAELAPRPDLPSSVRKLACPPGNDEQTRPGSDEAPGPFLSFGNEEATTAGVAPSAPSAARDRAGCAVTDSVSGEASAPPKPAHAATPAASRSLVRASAPQRFRVQFTIGQDTHDKLRRLQALMRREIPTGDVATIFDQAVDLMLEKVERAKLGAIRRQSRRPSARKGSATYENRIRFKTDGRGTGETEVSRPDAVLVANTDPTSAASREGTNAASTYAVTSTSADALSRRLKPTRHVPNRVKRAVWWRDRAQCAFVSATGHRCTQRAFLEIHHIQPYALDGPPTEGNLSLRCRRHNAYEAGLVFGTRRVATAEG